LRQSLHRKITTLFLCVTLLLVPRPARADGFVSSGQVAGIAIAIAAIGAAIGVGIYFLVRQPPSITGCATSSPDGLTLHNENDAQTFTLIGDTAAIKSGDRIRVSGKKKKADHSGKRDFLVEKVAKVYGPCKISPATPSL
jgi:hypothetical protein